MKIQSEHDGKGNIIIYINNVEMGTLENSEAHEFDREFNFNLQEADEAFYEFQQKHKD